MLKHRLAFGTLMILFFCAVTLLGGWIDGSLTTARCDDKAVQGTILCALICIIIIMAQLEISRLAATKNIKIFIPVSIISSILFATSWYWNQFIEMLPGKYLIFLLAFTMFALLLYQYAKYGVSGTLTNCGATIFSIMYIGGLSTFVIAIRADFGLWPFLMFVFVVKSSDIGAYAFGKMFGKRKFSPKISPGKTWEGMAGAVLAAIIVSVLFAINCDIIPVWLAGIYGLLFAFVGQLGDLAESMIKRDVEQKDASCRVPGFGGILDIIDSPLVAAPLAYLFFMFSIT
ncbi:MAG: phosphatidate cytidylyltransferase [Planctomycetota bacterium]|jgi:phosphatidate cytidylyltransferase